jgi:hypothetical protein
VHPVPRQLKAIWIFFPQKPLKCGLKDLSNPFEAFGGRIACFFKGLAMEELLSNQNGK